MIKKLLPKCISLTFILIFLIASFSMHAQSSARIDNAFNTETADSEDFRTQDIIISWNFTQTTHREQFTALAIEVQPLNSCWKELNGTNRSEEVTFPIDDFAQSHQGNLRLTHYQLKSKCFKWRAKITNNSGESYTEWQFSSFL